jgi:hypothetical protein
MRNSKKIKYLESRVFVLEYQFDLLSKYVTEMMDKYKVSAPELDAQKWYKDRLDETK